MFGVWLYVLEVTNYLVQSPEKTGPWICCGSTVPPCFRAAAALIFRHTLQSSGGIRTFLPNWKDYSESLVCRDSFNHANETLLAWVPWSWGGNDMHTHTHTHMYTHTTLFMIIRQSSANSGILSLSSPSNKSLILPASSPGDGLAHLSALWMYSTAARFLRRIQKSAGFLYENKNNTGPGLDLVLDDGNVINEESRKTYRNPELYIAFWTSRQNQTACYQMCSVHFCCVFQNRVREIWFLRATLQNRQRFGLTDCGITKMNLNSTQDSLCWMMPRR